MRDTMHEAYPGTASCCTAVAARAEGTVVHALYATRTHHDDTVAIGHPSGVMTIEARVHEEAGVCVVDRAVFGRTVRPIMRGEAWVRRAEVARLVDVLGPDSPIRTGVPAPE
jgi:2-methylaconitate cis-trans-isomerase PrpF